LQYLPNVRNKRIFIRHAPGADENSTFINVIRVRPANFDGGSSLKMNFTEQTQFSHGHQSFEFFGLPETKPTESPACPRSSLGELAAMPLSRRMNPR
jgi:hypothetical protein